MALFRYKAVSSAGEVREGEMEAGNQETVVKRLQAEGFLPIRAEQVQTAAASRAAGTPKRLSLLRRRRVSRKDVTVFTLELSTLLQAGLDLDKALEILASLAESEPLQRMVSSVHAAVRGGADLSAALEAQEGIFSHFYINMVRAGEAGGALEVALARLAEFMERSRELRESISSALIYPAILVVLAIVSVIVLLAFVVPRFAEMFQEAGSELPLATQVVVGIGEFFQHYWWGLALSMTGAYVYLRRQARDPAVRLRWDRWLLHFPLLGSLVTRMEAARFTRTLGTLLANGAHLLGAIFIAKEIIGNQVIAKAMVRVAESVREGQGLAKPLKEANVFPQLTGHLLQVGEETGNLEAMLLRLADIYEQEVQSLVRRLVTLIEPLVIIGLGLVVAGIIMSILVAILNVNELAF
jgi:general secretion pathway protein F